MNKKILALIVALLFLPGCQNYFSGDPTIPPTPIPTLDCLGDINGDGGVDDQEMGNIVQKKFGVAVEGVDYTAADRNSDGLIGDDEFAEAVFNNDHYRGRFLTGQSPVKCLYPR